MLNISTIIYIIIAIAIILYMSNFFTPSVVIPTTELFGKTYNKGDVEIVFKTPILDNIRTLHRATYNSRKEIYDRLIQLTFPKAYKQVSFESYPNYNDYEIKYYINETEYDIGQIKNDGYGYRYPTYNDIITIINNTLDNLNK